MELESINPSNWTWLDFLPGALIVSGFVAVMLAVMSGRKKTSIGLGAVFLCAIVVGAFAATTVEADTAAANRETVITHFEKSYGLKLDEGDLRYLRDVDQDDVTRNLETSGGTVKQVLFRVVDNKVLPYVMDGEGSWNLMSARGGKP